MPICCARRWRVGEAAGGHVAQQEATGLLRWRITGQSRGQPHDDGEALPLLDGVAQLVERHLMGRSIVIGRVMDQLERLVVETIV